MPHAHYTTISVLRISDSDIFTRILRDSYATCLIVHDNSYKSESLRKRDAAQLAHLNANLGVKTAIVNAFGTPYERTVAGAYSEGPLPSLMLFHATAEPIRPRLLSTEFKSVEQWASLIDTATAGMDVDHHNGMKLRHGASPQPKAEIDVGTDDINQMEL